jgi:hypothetical protein
VASEGLLEPENQHSAVSTGVTLALTWPLPIVFPRNENFGWLNDRCFEALPGVPMLPVLVHLLSSSH